MKIFHILICEMIAFIYDAEMRLHRSNDVTHEEKPERITETYQYLKHKGLLDDMVHLNSRKIKDEEMLLLHSDYYVKQMHKTSGIKGGQRKMLENRYSGDVFFNVHTSNAAFIAAGCALELAEQVHINRYEGGIALIRPPGHHSCPQYKNGYIGDASGFCHLNNVALSAKYMKEKYHIKVTIFDIDIHHGNGTQQLLENETDILYTSIHRYDGGHFYPGTGHPENEKAVNVGWNCYLEEDKPGNDEYIYAFRECIERKISKFCPDLILVSLGLDCVKGDPLGEIDVTPELFHYICKKLKHIAPTCLVLEGGYNISNIQLSMKHCIEGLRDSSLIDEPEINPKHRYMNDVHKTMKFHP